MKANERELFDVAELYRVFGDTTRVMILYTLIDGEACVNDIASALGMSLSAVSHQLRVLKQAHLVTYRREGKSALYSLADDHVRTILAQGLDHVRE